MGQVSMSNARSYDLAEFPHPAAVKRCGGSPRAALKPLLEDARQTAPAVGRRRCPRM